MSWQDYIGGLVVLAVSLVATWVKGISNKVDAHETRLSVAEAQGSAVLKLLEGIRDEVKGLREDAKDNQRELYAHIEAFRREVKTDLAGKQDRA